MISQLAPRGRPLQAFDATSAPSLRNPAQPTLIKRKIGGIPGFFIVKVVYLIRINVAVRKGAQALGIVSGMRGKAQVSWKS